ncbi:LD-carboxypeptidase [Acinetobacter defluvii]|uniref:LD-carboxypeptidase n=1 Tax=Acinetobacter defluvii TaxID=1871111 RepID=UPI0014901186|nr:LD-carboxypeptidase [Acinetobacter defluvii]NNP71648.1 LD-carboxypeptidase [Acinetobacter defluvii]
MKISLKFISTLAISLYFSISSSHAKDTIYLISSSSAYDESYIPKITQAFKNKGFNVSTEYLNQQLSDFGYVNTDHERAKNLIHALKNNQVKYLWFVRGGSGALNLLPKLHAEIAQIKQSTPKVLIGFSDVTAIHYFINNEIGWKSIHGTTAATGKIMNAPVTTPSAMDEAPTAKADMLNPDENQNDVVNEIFTTIQSGIHYQGLLPLNSAAKQHFYEGTLTGGNLTLVQTLFSTQYERSWDNKILLLEDVSVTYKQLDRLLHQILFKKDFKPKAIVFGQFYPSKTNDGERLIYKEVIRTFAEQNHIPVYYYPYFGHGKVNKPFILGGKAHIACPQDSDYCSIFQEKL